MWGQAATRPNKKWKDIFKSYAYRKDCTVTYYLEEKNQGNSQPTESTPGGSEVLRY